MRDPTLRTMRGYVGSRGSALDPTYEPRHKSGNSWGGLKPSPNASRTATSLTLLRRPAIGLGAGAAHQHRALAVAQALGLHERVDRLLVIDHGEGAGPVGAPQAALEPPGI